MLEWTCHRFNAQIRRHDISKPFYFKESGVSVTYLQHAIRNRQETVIRHLLKRRGYVDDVDNDGQSALHYAWDVPEYVELIHDLLDAGVDVNVASKSRGNTVLHKSGAPLEYYQAVLRTNRCDVINRRNKDENTPLQVAVNDLRHDLVSELLENGADAFVKDNAGNTLLHVALQSTARSGSDAVVTLLLSRGVDPTARNARGETLLHVAQPSPGRIQAVLEDGRCDVNARNASGMMALHRLCRDHSFSLELDHCVFLLLKHGAIINTSQEVMSCAFRRYLEQVSFESHPAFRLILLISAGLRLDGVVENDIEREQLVLRHLPRRHISTCLPLLRPLLPQTLISKKEMQELVRTAEEPERIVELISSPISMQERCLQVVRVECHPNALAAAHHLPLPRALISKISP